MFCNLRSLSGFVSTSFAEAAVFSIDQVESDADRTCILTSP